LKFKNPVSPGRAVQLKIILHPIRAIVADLRAVHADHSELQVEPQELRDQAPIALAAEASPDLVHSGLAPKARIALGQTAAIGLGLPLKDSGVELIVGPCLATIPHVQRNPASRKRNGKAANATFDKLLPAGYICLCGLRR
jgi:hypothetical protein